MSKHTPGPWAFCNQTLCQATGNYKHLGEWRESPGLGREAAANARLIEQAPALLAALQAARMELWRLLDVKGVAPREARQWPEIVAADAAIAKATGGAL